MTTLELYDLAERDHIDIVDCPALSRDGVSALLADGSCVIGLKRPQKAVLAHELGHCECLSFYEEKSPYGLRSRAETRAQKWAIRHVVSRNELLALIGRGFALWEIAEYLEIDEAFVKDALSLYFLGHL